MSEPLATEPNVVHVKPDEVLKQIEAYMAKMPHVACVILIGPRGDPAHVAALSNTTPGATREMLRTAQGKPPGRIRVPFRE